MLKENALGYMFLNVITAVLVPSLLVYTACASAAMYYVEEKFARKRALARKNNKIFKNLYASMPSAKAKKDIKIIRFSSRKNYQKAA